MVEITILENTTNIKTNDINIFIDGDFELKKEGVKAPEVSVIANSQSNNAQTETSENQPKSSQLIKNETSVARTTDADKELNNKIGLLYSVMNEKSQTKH